MIRIIKVYTLRNLIVPPVESCPQVPTAAKASLARDLYQHCNHKCGQKIDSITVTCKNFELLVVIFWTYNATFSPSMSRALPSAVFYGCFAGCHFLALVRCKCVKGLSVVLLALSAERSILCFGNQSVWTDYQWSILYIPNIQSNILYLKPHSVFRITSTQ